MQEINDFLRGEPGCARPRRGRIAFAVAALLAIGACEGENLFDNDSSGLGKPEIVEMTVPDSVDAGRIVDVQVHAQGDRRIVGFELRLRGAMGRDSLLGVLMPLTDLQQTISFVVVPPVQDTVLEVTVQAIDQAGSASDPATDTIWIRDVTAPAFDGVVVEPTTTGAGETVSISVKAADNIDLASLGYGVLNADGETISSELAPVAGSKSDSLLFQYIVPFSTPPGPLLIVGLATDQEGLLGVSAPVVLTIEDRSEPAVEITRPGGGATFPLGDSILVEFRVVDNAGVTSARLSGVALRGDPDLGTQEEIARFDQKTISLPELPQDTTLTRFLIATGDRTSETVLLIVTATDESGEVGVDTMAVSIGGPRVDIRSPEDGRTVQSAVAVTLFASDPSQIESLRLFVSGVVSDTIAFAYDPPLDSVIERPVINLPATAGTLTLQAEATSVLGVPGRSTPVTLTVDPNTGGTVGDELPPSVRLEILPCNRMACDRMEATDSVRVRVTAEDNSVISRLGLAAIATNTANDDTLTIQVDSVFTTPVSGQPQVDFWFNPFNLDPLSLPDTLRIDVYAFAVDGAGNCGAGRDAEMRSLPCGTFKGDTVAANEVGYRVDALVVSGRTVMLPDGGEIADATVDTVRQRLYFSNFTARKIDVLDLVADAFDPNGVTVGAAPWGMTLNRTEDTLIVANSGGTNLSFIPLDGPLAEDGARRLKTPNVVLYQILETEEAAGGREYRYVGRGDDDFISFSDRPQFVTQDATGLILYSTVPTSATAEGTLRFVDANPDPATTLDEPEAKLLFNNNAIAADVDNMVIAHVDSVWIWDADDDLLQIWDHKYGFPDSLITSGKADRATAVANIAALGSDIRAGLGKWVIEEIGMSDTTFLAASGDREWVAFGDGATAPFAQIIMWSAQTRSISSDVNVSDLIENAAERVRGVGLNLNGSLGVAKGTDGVYFFDTGLRLQGEFTEEIAAGGSGAVLHPAHPDYETLAASSDSTLAFAGTGRRSILIVDTWNFRIRGEIQIRDNITGPLRATLPLPGDLTDPVCLADPTQCVMVKLYGVTAAGGVVVVNVREKDILDLP